MSKIFALPGFGLRAQGKESFMRVITGSARGRKLITVPGMEVVRPTTDRVKEALFSAVQFEIEGALVVDLFAGSGQLGIEALSRGARGAVFIDSSRQSIDVIKQNLSITGLMKQARVALMDALSFLRSTHERFDLAFLDPPYHSGLIQQALPLLGERMQGGGMILCETDRGEKLPEESGPFRIARRYRHSKTIITLYRKAEGEWPYSG